MGELAALVKKHPELIGVAVILVVIIAWFQSKGSGASSSSGDVSFVGGGVHNAPVDPNVAAIQEAQIGANSANLTTLSQLWLGLNQASYARDVQEGQTGAALSASLAQTEASRVLGLASLETQSHIADVQSGTTIQTARIAADEQTTQANISRDTAQAVLNANLESERLNNARQLEINATQRDIARVDAKKSFWGNLFGGAESVLAAIFA